MNFSYLTGEVGKLGIARISKRIVSANNAVVYDTFTGADDTLLTAHTPDIAPGGAAWANIAGSFKIGSNRALGNGAGLNLAMIESGLENCTITAKSTLSAYTGLVFRCSLSSGWMLEYQGGTARLYEAYGAFVRATSANLTLSPYSIPLDSLITTTVTLSGTSIICAVNGITFITYTSAVDVTNTKHGIYIPYNGAIWIDDFMVTA